MSTPHGNVAQLQEDQRRQDGELAALEFRSHMSGKEFKEWQARQHAELDALRKKMDALTTQLDLARKDIAKSQKDIEIINRALNIQLESLWDAIEDLRTRTQKT